jgi:hypothetical protein
MRRARCPLLSTARFKPQSCTTLQGASQPLKKPETDEMRKTILRRLEFLEREHRSREQEKLDSLAEAKMYLWLIALGYYLGDLQSDEKDDPFEGSERALKVSNGLIYEQYNDAYRRLFAKVGLDFDATPRNVLFDAFVTMVNRLPDQWLDWLRTHLRKYCLHAEIPAGSNIPRGLSGDDFLFL